jgi:hypothetical protein
MTAASATRPRAYVVHAMAGRARLRFDEQRGNAAFFDDLVNQLERHPNVLQVRASSHTGSILMLHTGDLPTLIAHAQKKSLFDIEAPKPPPIAFRRIRDAIDSADDAVAKGTGDALSVGKLVFAGLLTAGFFQAKRGHLWPAGLTLFKHALELLDWVAEREAGSSQDRAQSVSHS